jgi:hypothetical protein
MGETNDGNTSEEETSAVLHLRTSIILGWVLWIVGHGEVPIIVATRSEGGTAFARSNAGIVGSNPLKAWMPVLYVFILCFCCSMCR